MEIGKCRSVVGLSGDRAEECCRCSSCEGCQSCSEHCECKVCASCGVPLETRSVLCSECEADVRVEINRRTCGAS